MDVRLALTGFGNVGQGVATLIDRYGNQYRERYGIRLILSGVADRSGAAIDRGGLHLPHLLEVKREEGSVAAIGQKGLAGDDFLEASNAHVLIEAASTNFTDAEPGWGYVRSALDRQMHVVLASKGALVLHFHELMGMAANCGRDVLFSGAVGAPLPVLELSDRMLVSDSILGFEGVVNGTSNFVLLLMAEGLSYDTAVREAQRIGIAETDPTLDVDGIDAAAKAVIISNAVFGADLRLEDVPCRGIRQITLDQIHDASRRGGQIKLIARAKRRDGRISAEVLPEFRDNQDVLGRLGKNEMGIVFKTELLGDVAATVTDLGGIPTAATVLRDVLNLTRERS